MLRRLKCAAFYAADKRERKHAPSVLFCVSKESNMRWHHDPYCIDVIRGPRLPDYIGRDESGGFLALNVKPRQKFQLFALPTHRALRSIRKEELVAKRNEPAHVTGSSMQSLHVPLHAEHFNEMFLMWNEFRRFTEAVSSAQSQPRPQAAPAVAPHGKRVRRSRAGAENGAGAHYAR